MKHSTILGSYDSHWFCLKDHTVEGSEDSHQLSSSEFAGKEILNELKLDR